MRLDELERRVAALTVGGGRGFPRIIRRPDEFYQLVKQARSRFEALEITHSALRGGLSLNLVSKVLRSALPPPEEKTILREIGLPRHAGG